MTYQEVMTELESYGDERTKNTLLKHGAQEPFFGVKVADLKKILKKTKNNHALALELYNSGNSDAMYLAGLMADANKVSKAELQDWVKKAYWYYISEFTVPWLAAESAYGFELGLEWIESDKEQIANAGWSALSNVASIKPTDELNVEAYRSLLQRVKKEVHQAPNRVRYTMNGFVIAVGSYIPELYDEAMSVAEHIGKVEVTMGSTACKVPLATEYLSKVKSMDRIGKKRKQARC